MLNDDTLGIKFAKWFSKMPTNTPAKPTYLIGVCEVRIEKLPKQFVNYDTHYFDENNDFAGAFYPLNKARKWLMITLYTDDHVWTTLREYSPDKLAKYTKHIGERVQIIMDNVDVEI